MNNEEAVEQLDDLRVHCKEMAEEHDKPEPDDENPWADDIIALTLAIKALQTGEK